MKSSTTPNSGIIASRGRDVLKASPPASRGPPPPPPRRRRRLGGASRVQSGHRGSDGARASRHCADAARQAAATRGGARGGLDGELKTCVRETSKRADFCVRENRQWRTGLKDCALRSKLKVCGLRRVLECDCHRDMEGGCHGQGQSRIRPRMPECAGFARDVLQASVVKR
eukprot:2126498-Pleurochrysis_carterae.AAC.1